MQHDPKVWGYNTIERIIEIPIIQKMKFTELNFTYDKGADVLYIRIGTRQKATRTDDSEYPVLYRYNNEELIGITVINYSQR